MYTQLQAPVVGAHWGQRKQKCVHNPSHSLFKLWFVANHELTTGCPTVEETMVCFSKSLVCFLAVLSFVAWQASGVVKAAMKFQALVKNKPQSTRQEENSGYS